MWKILTGKSEQLPELLVVLAITVIIAAILLPAVTSSNGNEVNAESGLDAIVWDGGVSSSLESRSERRERPSDARGRADDAPATREMETPATDEAESGAAVMPAAREGQEHMRTTDISYTIP